MNSSYPFLHQEKSILDQSFLRLAQHGDLLRPALVGADSEAALQTAVMAKKQNIAQSILIGNADRIMQLSQQAELDISGLEIIPADDESDLMPKALRLISEGKADSLMKGQVHTDVYMRGVLAKEGGLRSEKGGRIVHVFAMLPSGGGRALLISDAAVNVAPDLASQQQSLSSSVALAQRMGVERPKVAVLSATESEIESVPSSIQAGELVRWAQDQQLSADIAGPLALDGALSPEAANIKGINGLVAGDADIVLVPDIVSGNVLFKALVWFKGAIAAGVVLGARVPVILTSRADPPQARLASVALAKLMK